MVTTVTYNPMQTTNGAGAFGITWDGYMQGIMMDDPVDRQKIAGGVLASTETLPMWGGVGICERIPTNPGTSSGWDQHLGGSIIRATNVTANTAGNLTGFCVFNQAHNAIMTPSSPVPLIASQMTLNFVRLGSGARLAVNCDPALVSLQAGIINPQVSWDFNAQVLQPYDAATATYSITSQTGTFNSGTGVWTVAVVMGVASLVGAVGDTINISGATNSGTGGTGLINGNKVVTAFTDNQHFSYQVTAPTGAIGTAGGTQVINAGVGALNVKVLDVKTTNCMTVVYDTTSGFATWNRSGACALILI